MPAGWAGTKAESMGAARRVRTHFEKKKKKSPGSFGRLGGGEVVKKKKKIINTEIQNTIIRKQPGEEGRRL